MKAQDLEAKADEILTETRAIFLPKGKNKRAFVRPIFGRESAQFADGSCSPLGALGERAFDVIKV